MDITIVRWYITIRESIIVNENVFVIPTLTKFDAADIEHEISITFDMREWYYNAAKTTIFIL